ncbi:acetyl-CoA carboxylase biotin carboxyl carrier protein [candidate division KSB1 bacterium]|nr:acetyl-CoA carboxylase biotin carboxyl carrier protein [candidate division KSB1 bacterium]RQW00423.1 MAG: acetyl-CoA carboxylase biotin carboxyl carrier protein [candidate division KSB1 bacterium]
MRVKQIQDLVRIVENSDIDEIEVTKWWGRKVRIRKCANSNKKAAAAAVVPVTSPEAPLPPPEPNPVATTVEQPIVSKNVNYVEIKAPMVGTFYRSPAPDSPAYVNEGEVVSKGQILCIIEAMKLMNELEADVSGRIVKILIDNAQPIEYNQPLFLIDPS